MFGWRVPEYVPGLPWWPLAVVVVAIVLMNVVNNKVAPRSHYLLWCFAGSVILVAIGLLDGNSFTDMGLGWTFVLPGLAWALASILVVMLVYVIGAMSGRMRQVFHDESIGALSGSRLAFRALVEVPFGTVLLEEIAFRAVLFSMLARRFGLWWALGVSAIMFGIWHVLPSIGSHLRNPGLGSVVGKGKWGNVRAVLGSVIATTAGGVGFSLMRIISGSVIAPMGMHWATNGLGYGFTWLLVRGRRKGS